jgi:hypothetical protein
MAISARQAPALDLPARFMALSLASFAVITLSAPWTLHMTQGFFTDFRLLALVHLVTLGFVGSMIIGASYQLVPVVLQTQLASVTAGRISFWFYGAGLAVFLAGLFRTWLPGLAIGGTLLAGAFLLYTGTVFTTWLRAPHHEVIGWHIVLGMAGALMGMSMGVVLAFNKSNGVLGEGYLGFLGAHIVFMIGGWVAITLMGVAYRLICMFTLSEKYFRPWLAWTSLALVFTGSWGFATALHLEWPRWTSQALLVLLLAGFVCFVVQVERLYRMRMRKAVDIHMPFVIAAGAMLLAVPVLVFIGVSQGVRLNDPIWVASVWLALIGVAGTAIQGFFYKISTFLVWLKRYAPVAGKGKAPKLEEMYDRRLALAGFVVWVAAVSSGAACLLAEVDAMPVVGAGMAVAALCFLGNVGRIARHWAGGPRLSIREPVVSRQPHLRAR